MLDHSPHRERTATNKSNKYANVDREEILERAPEWLPLDEVVRLDER